MLGGSSEYRRLAMQHNATSRWEEPRLQAPALRPTSRTRWAFLGGALCDMKRRGEALNPLASEATAFIA